MQYRKTTERLHKDYTKTTERCSTERVQKDNRKTTERPQKDHRKMQYRRIQKDNKKTTEGLQKDRVQKGTSTERHTQRPNWIQPVIMHVASSASFLANTSVKSPRKLFILIIENKHFPDQSIQKSILFNFENGNTGGIHTRKRVFFDCCRGLRQ